MDPPYNMQFLSKIHINNIFKRKKEKVIKNQKQQKR